MRDHVRPAGREQRVDDRLASAGARPSPGTAIHARAGMSRRPGATARARIDDRDRVGVDRRDQRVDVVDDLDRAQRRTDEPLQRALRLALGVRDDELARRRPRADGMHAARTLVQDADRRGAADVAIGRAADVLRRRIAVAVVASSRRCR